MGPEYNLCGLEQTIHAYEQFHILSGWGLSTRPKIKIHALVSFPDPLSSYILTLWASCCYS